MLNDNDLERYARQVIIPMIGEPGQKKLLKSSVLVVGAGGLGGPVILYLAAAGIGTINIIDCDTVSRPDLNRQIIYKETEVEKNKASAAATAASSLNSAITINVYNEKLREENVKNFITQSDVIIDCTDNSQTRYLLGDASHKYNRPLVFGGAVRMEGQVSVFQSSVTGYLGTPCYRCIFPEAPNIDQAPGCSEAGILGPVTGVVGSLQALETIKLITGISETLTGRLLLIDASTSTFLEIKTTPRPDCKCCGNS